MKEKISRFENSFVSNAGSFKNFNLLYNKFPKFDGEKFIFYEKAETGRNSKSAFFLGESINRGVCKGFFDANVVKGVSDNYYKTITSLGYQTQDFSTKPDWRMVIGLGGESVYETGMTLHHIYGFPYIPATAIKGIAHHYAKEKGEQQIIDIFGSEDTDNPQRGKIIFFDAFPMGEITLSPDIMNNHYPDYYDGAKKPPADWQSPRPIFFLTLKNTSFKFVVGMKQKDYDTVLLEKAASLLKVALQEKGIGAKTAVGYGYMK